MKHGEDLLKSKSLIVALDLADQNEILHLARLLRDDVAMVKVGLEAFAAYGPDLVRRLVGEGLEVFLDLKLHDIPNTVAHAAKQLANLKVRLLTVHASGGGEMIQAARENLETNCKLIAVTVLTSLNEGNLDTLGFRGSPAEVATRWGQLALQHGADGLVCSAHELAVLQNLGGLRVVPGIRPANTARGDQRRVATPRDAIKQGATWIVVGRPIVQAVDPLAVVRAINSEIAVS